MIWFESRVNAEWQNHCSFCAAVVVSAVHEDQVEKLREENKDKKRTSQRTKGQQRQLRGNEARDTSRATWFGWSVAQTAGVSFFFTRDPGAAAYRVS